MKKIILLLLFITSSGSAWASNKLDITYIHPSPTKALLWSMVFPGGGHIYLNSYSSDKSYGAMGGVFFVVQAAGAIYLSSVMAKKNNSAEMHKYVIPGVFITMISFKIWEFDNVIEGAERERYRIATMPGFKP
jgi:hypothetical protein